MAMSYVGSDNCCFFLHQHSLMARFPRGRLCACVQLVGVEGDVENPLDKPEVLEAHIQFLPLICRYQYRTIGEFIVSTMATIWGKVCAGWHRCNIVAKFFLLTYLLTVVCLSQQTKHLIQRSYASGGDPSVRLMREIIENQLAWMTYICSALVVSWFDLSFRNASVGHDWFYNPFLFRLFHSL